MKKDSNPINLDGAPDPRELLLAHHLGQGGERTFEGELAKLRALPVPSREVALLRLAVIDQLLRYEEPSLEDADRAAEKLGMSRRNLYRLIARVKERGPALGLAPYARAAASTRGSERQLDPLTESVIAEELARAPNVRIGKVDAAVQRAFKSQGGEPPSRAAIGRRLTMLRRAGGTSDRVGWASDRAFGRLALIDQSAVEARPLGVTINTALVFIVDTETRLVLGCGHCHVDHIADGLQRALADARARAASFVVGRFPVANNLEHVRWIVPDEFVDVVDHWGWMAAASAKIARAKLGPRRHGQRLVRLLGSSFNPFRLKPRVIGEKDRFLGDGTADLPVRDLTAEVRRATDAWNYKVLEAASGLPPSLDSAVQRERLASWRDEHSGDVEKAVDRIIAPLEAALEENLQPRREAC